MTRVIRGMLYGVAPTDATSYALGALVLVAVSAAACLLPTRRAMAVDPVVAMRAE